MESQEEEYKGDRSIDPEALDVEVVRQVDTFAKWSRRYVKARVAADRSEHALKLLGSKLQLRCRLHPEKFGLTNPTEAGIRAAVESSKAYNVAVEELFVLRERALHLEKCVAAMEMKRRMLESLITLHGQEWFAGPRAPRDLAGLWNESHHNRQKKVQDRARDRQVEARRKRDDA